MEKVYLLAIKWDESERSREIQDFQLLGDINEPQSFFFLVSLNL